MKPDHQTFLLLIEDYPADAALITMTLQRRASDRFIIEHADSVASGLEIIDSKPVDLVLLDLTLPDSAGKDSFHRVYSHAPDVPIMVLTGLEDEELGLELISQGAQDFVVKGRVNGDSLVRSIRFAIERQTMLKSRMLKSQKESINREYVRESPFQDIMKLNDEGIVVSELDGTIRFANPAAGSLFGCSPEDLEGQPFHFPISANESKEIEIPRDRGQSVFVEMRAIESAWESDAFYTIWLRDITEKKLLEEKVSRAYGMENVGRFASGIAHDLNNVLTVIMSYSAMGSNQYSSSEMPGTYFRGIYKTAKRATELTRQLLTFSSPQMDEPELVDPGEMILEMGDILQKLIGPNFELSLYTAEDLANVRIVSWQIEQVILNLVANARDAMADGGDIILHTSNAEPDEVSDLLDNDPEVSTYVKFGVRDFGIGMDEDVRASLFEPFFTTKGEGTGLGLWTSNAIVTRCGGKITVDSEPGKGSWFTVYLPAVEEDL